LRCEPGFFGMTAGGNGTATSSTSYSATAGGAVVAGGGATGVVTTGFGGGAGGAGTSTGLGFSPRGPLSPLLTSLPIGISEGGTAGGGFDDLGSVGFTGGMFSTTGVTPGSSAGRNICNTAAAFPGVGYRWFGSLASRKLMICCNPSGMAGL